MWIKVIGIPIIVTSVSCLLLIWINHGGLSLGNIYLFIHAYWDYIWNFQINLMGLMGIHVAYEYRDKLYCMCKNEFYRFDGEKNLSKCEEFEGKYSKLHKELRKKQSSQ